MLSLRSIVGISAILKAVQAFPNLPFTVDGPLILDSEGNSVKTAGTNWPGHNDVMIPEGLQYTSIEKVVSDIKSLGMNVVRLTYAIEMIDQIYANDGQDVSIQTAFEDALGVENATVILENVLRNNPQFTAESTRLEIFDAVVEELDAQEIYVNLDNHMSSGEWCCSTDDGNSWWGDEFFNADNWVRGLGYMAEHAANWPNLMSMSIRNELREPSNGPDTVEPYTWEVWYNYVRRGADAVNAANPDPIVILSGLNFDTTMQPVVRGEALTPSDTVFSFDDFEGYADKLAIELHNYNTETDDCPGLQGSLYNGGAQAMNPDEETTVNTFPVLITEFGFNMEDDTYQGVYSTCLAEWMPGNTAGWMQWVVVGSYYMRSGEQDYDETWGLYNHDWSAWRNEEYIEGVMKPSIEATLS